MKECHRKELKRRGILCTCLSGDNGVKDGALPGNYVFIFANPEALIHNKNIDRHTTRASLQSRVFKSKANHLTP